MKLISAEVLHSRHSARVNAPSMLRDQIWVQVSEGIEVSEGEIIVDSDTGYHYYKGSPIYELDSVMDSPFLRPTVTEDGPISELCGPSSSGSFACNSDSRFPSSNALRLHDRYDTWEAYERLSR